MKKINLLKKIVGFTSAILVALTPVTAMAAEVSDIDAGVEKSQMRSYTDWIDDDISIYIPEVGDTLHAHLKLLYSYSEGSWVYIADDPVPTLSNICMDNGSVKTDYVTAQSSYGSVKFDIYIGSDEYVKRVTLHVSIDNYGDIDYYTTVFL